MELSFHLLLRTAMAVTHSCACASESWIGLLVNSNFSDVETQLKDVPAAASVLGLRITVLNANSERDIDTAFATLVQQRIGALLVASI
jgi:hypothetical protein